MFFLHLSLSQKVWFLIFQSYFFSWLFFYYYQSILIYIKITLFYKTFSPIQSAVQRCRKTGEFFDCARKQGCMHTPLYKTSPSQSNATKFSRMVASYIQPQPMKMWIFYSIFMCMPSYTACITNIQDFVHRDSEKKTTILHSCSCRLFQRLLMNKYQSSFVQTLPIMR